MLGKQFVSDEARDVLARATTAGEQLKLNSGKLERDLYDEVNEVLSRLGGKWKGGKTAAHLFDALDAAKLRDCLDIVITTGRMPPKNPNAFFYTPAPVRARMLERFADLIQLKSGMRFLEPSAGKGHLYFGWKEFFEDLGYTVNPDPDAPLPDLWVRIEAVEIDEAFRTYLEAKGVPIVYAQDFLGFNPSDLYDGVLMNPPFDRENNPNVYIDHILHAYYACLKPGGSLVSVTSVGFTIEGNQRVHKIAGFKALVEEVGSWEDLPAKSFAEAGTGANTCLITMQKPEEESDGSPSDSTEEAPASLSVTPASSVPQPAISPGAPDKDVSDLQETSEEGAGKTEGSSAQPVNEASPGVLKVAREQAETALGQLYTFGVDPQRLEELVTPFQALWQTIAGRKIIYDVRTRSVSETRASALPAFWQPATLRGRYGFGYFQRTSFKHNARRIAADEQAGGTESNVTWEVSLSEGSIEELVYLLRRKCSLLLLSDGAAFEGSLRHAIVVAIQEQLPELLPANLG